MKYLTKYVPELLLSLAVISIIIGKTDNWDKSRIVGVYDGIPFTEFSRAYFTSTDIAVSLMLLTICLIKKRTLPIVLFALSIGKILDEFTCPFRLGIAELSLMGCAALYLLFKLITSIKNART